MSKTTVQKITAVVLSVLFLCLGLGAAAPLQLQTPLPTYTETSVYEDYPLDLNLIVDQSHAQYKNEAVSVDDLAPYYPVIPDSLEVDVLATVKETVEANSIHVSISRGDTVLCDADWTEESSFRIESLPIGEICVVTVIIETDTQTQTYIGQFSWLLDVQNEVALTISYDKNVIEKGTRNTPVAQEEESNNSPSEADQVMEGRTVTGRMLDKWDEDWYYFYVGGFGTTTQIAITLVTPNNGNPPNYNIAVYGSSGETGALTTLPYTNQTGTTDEFFMLLNNTYDNIYVKVSIPSSDAAEPNPTTPYYLNLNVSNKETGKGTWYSQRAGTINGITYWNTNKLDSLYFPNAKGSYKKSHNSIAFIVDNSTTINDDIMREGCYVASLAMLLRNMGKTYSVTDFRTGYVGPMYADPYTVFLANQDYTGTEVSYNSQNSHYEITAYQSSYSPVYVLSNNIESNFSVTIDQTDLSKMSNAEKAQEISNALALNSEGVIVCSTKPSDKSTHYLVICGDRGSNYTPEQRFYVYDPSGLVPTRGNHVLYVNSHSNVHADRPFSTLTSLYCIS